MESNGFIKVAPTLIVGFGGTGSLGVQYAKRKIRKQLQHLAGGKQVPEKLPFVEYVVLDTTPQEEFIEDLPGDEYVNLGHVNVPRLIKYVDHDPTLRAAMTWFPRHINPGQIDAGARGVRHIGRLCFFNRLPLVDDTIRSKVQSVTNYASVDRILKEQCNYLTMEPGSTIDVHLITSLCGGTGSACLLDAAYLIKHIVNELLQQGTNSVAHLLTTEAFVGDNGVNATSREYIKYNFAVSMAEIERFMNFEVTLSGSETATSNGSWKVKYLDGREIHSVEKPFSLAYLLGYKEGETISKKNLCEIVGDAIALSTVHPENHQLKGLLDNAKAHVVTQKNAVGKVKAYSSYNTRTISAEFNDQTLGASLFLACETILDAMVSKDVQADYDQLLADFRKDMVAQSEYRYIFELSRGPLNLACDDIEGVLAINKEKFNDVERRILKAAGKKQWPWSKNDRVVQDQIYIGREGYNLVRAEYNADARKIGYEFEGWVASTRGKLPNKIYGLLMEGYSMPVVAGVLKYLSDEMKQVVRDIDQRREEMKLPGSEDAAWMKDAILRKQYSDEAVEHMKTAILMPLLATIQLALGELTQYLDDLFKACSAAEQCLNRTKEFVKEKSAKSYSFTESSLWTREKVNEKIKEPAIIKTLVKSFIKAMERQFKPRDQNAEKPIGFLWYLDPHDQEIRKNISKLLGEVAHDIVEDEFQKREIDFNPIEGNNSHTVIANEELNRFVEMAAPTWQIQRAGEDITQISITNCPRETKIGRLISSLGKNITFTEFSNDPKNILIFRSEHGVTADRLLNLGDCVAALRRRLKIEEKTHIKELSLDPSWDIEEPGASVSEEQMLALFSLGTMFHLIRKDFRAYWFVGEEHEEVLLSQSVNAAQPAERSTAFIRFMTLRSHRNHDVLSLIRSIEEQWQSARDPAIEEFLKRICEYKAELESNCKDDNADNVAQWGREIMALQNEVIPPLETFIKTLNRERNMAARAQASSQ